MMSEILKTSDELGGAVLEVNFECGFKVVPYCDNNPKLFQAVEPVEVAGTSENISEICDSSIVIALFDIYSDSSIVICLSLRCILVAEKFW